MSKKHNTKHRRSPSHYKDRLEARGLKGTPRMTQFRLEGDGQMSDKTRGGTGK